MPRLSTPVRVFRWTLAAITLFSFVGAIFIHRGLLGLIGLVGALIVFLGMVDLAGMRSLLGPMPWTRRFDDEY